jgi:TonB-dependent receptor
MKSLNVLITILLFCSLALKGFAQQGYVSGKVIDQARNESLIGATVMLNNNPAYAAYTDIDGLFKIAVPAGTYKLTAQYVSYNTKEIEGVVVSSGSTTTINISLESSVSQLKQVVITSTYKKENINSLLMIQKNSVSVQDGISSDLIKRSPDRSSGDVLKRISGTSIQDNKFVIVRGLSDKYNNAMMNGSILPSTEPDRKTFSFDLIPANMLESIVIIKTAQPDLPGDFAGGIIQQNLRDVPEKNFINLSINQSYNSVTTFRSYNKYNTGSTGWLGLNDGTLSLPENFPTRDTLLKSTKTERLEFSKLLTNSWDTSTVNRIPFSQTYSLSLGWSPDKKNQRFGVLFSSNYNQNFRTEQLTRSDFTADATKLFEFDDTYNRTNVNAGGMLRVSYKLNKANKIGFSTSYNINSVFETGVRSGTDFDAGVYQNGISEYTIINQLQNSGVYGEHFFATPKIKITWNGNYNYITRSEPDFRRIYYSKNIIPQSASDTVFKATVPLTGSPSPSSGGRFFSYLEESTRNGGIHISKAFKLGSTENNIKTGYTYTDRTRSFEARVLGYVVHSSSKFNQQENPDSILALPADLIFSADNIRDNGFRLDEITNKSDNYTAGSTNHSTYLMIDNKLNKRIRVIWGARAEFFTQQLNSQYNTGDTISVLTRSGDSTSLPFDFLPSLNFIYSLTEKTNIRLSASKTVSRPEFRELAPFSFFDFLLNTTVQGNPKLRRTNIYNYDVRVEHYPGNGQVIALSGFYKYFDQPVEQIIDDAVSSGGSRARNFANIQNAVNYGVEIEFRKNFDFADKWFKTKYLTNLYAQMNLALINSQIRTDTIQTLGGTRALQGQSPYVLNCGIGYADPDNRFNSTILYNVIGRRIREVGTSGYPDIFEAPRNVIDFQFTGRINKFLSVKVAASDILRQPFRLYQDRNLNGKYDEDGDTLIQQSIIGSNTSISLLFQF